MTPETSIASRGPRNRSATMRMTIERARSMLFQYALPKTIPKCRSPQKPDNKLEGEVRCCRPSARRKDQCGEDGIRWCSP